MRVCFRGGMRILRSLLFSAVLALGQMVLGVHAVPIPDEVCGGGFAIGVQAYSFRQYSVLEAIERTAKTGARVVEFYDGQRLAPGEEGVFGHNSSPADIKRVKQALAKHGIRAVNYGVVPIPNKEPAARKIFDFARTMGLYAITTESDGSIELIEKLVKEYDIRVGFHNHPRQGRNKNYKVWDPKYILSLVKDRDPRIGAAADIGHWTTDRLDVVASLKLLEGRLVSLHIKDRKVVGHPVKNVPVGSGVIAIDAVLDELQRQGFQGNISIEYEDKWADNVPEITQSVAFLRGHDTRKAVQASGK